MGKEPLQTKEEASTVKPDTENVEELSDADLEKVDGGGALTSGMLKIKMS